VVVFASSKIDLLLPISGGNVIAALDLLRHRLSCLGFVALLFLPASGQEEAVTSADSSATSAATSVVTSEPVAAPGDSVASVMLSGTELFSVTSQSVVGAQERADAMNEAILEVAKSRRRGPEDLHLVQDERIQATLIMCDNLLLGAVWNYEAEAVASTPEANAS